MIDGVAVNMAVGGAGADDIIVGAAVKMAVGAPVEISQLVLLLAWQSASRLVGQSVPHRLCSRYMRWSVSLAVGASVHPHSLQQLSKSAVGAALGMAVCSRYGSRTKSPRLAWLFSSVDMAVGASYGSRRWHGCRAALDSWHCRGLVGIADGATAHDGGSTHFTKNDRMLPKDDVDEQPGHARML